MEISNRQTEESSTIKPSQPWDWTYTTKYSGSTSNVFSTSNDVNDTIPIDKLSDTNQPILFYDDVQLYEDELGDNGQVGLNVKIVGLSLFYDLYLKTFQYSVLCHSVGSFFRDSSCALIRFCSGCLT